MIRENWRVAVLIVLLVASGIALFVPGVGLGATDSGPTNLQYGLDLAGGTSIRAPLVGWTATDVDVGDRNGTAVSDAVADNLENVSSPDVVYRPRSQTSGAVEVRANVNQSAFVSALEAAGLSADNVRAGVTQETRDQAIQVISNKVDQSGLAGGTVQSVYSPANGRYYIQIEVPGAGLEEAQDLIQARGQVRIYAFHSETRNGTTVWTNTTALTQDGFQQVSIAQEGTEGGQGPHVPVTIKPSEAPQFRDIMVESEIATNQGSDCGWAGAIPGNESTGPCLLIVSDGEVVGFFGMRDDLGQSMVSEDWLTDPRFILPTGNYSEARQLSIILRAGTLPTDLALGDGSTQSISASKAGDTKFQALLTGIVAVLAVAGVVFIRYRDVAVAAPMVVTALSEVVILLGFAAAIGMALDLSHLAGFIAVIGTGVDDLIIIANEVRAEGRISGGRVFQNRFRKAFWVIGAAAITTIIAMSPLAFLSLGDLRGFAFVTILGVLVGLLITRPAYGDILRTLVAEK